MPVLAPTRHSGHYALRDKRGVGGRSAVKVALIAAAGAAGALSRYGLSVAIGVRSFPWATLGINLTGSLLLGFVLPFGFDRGWSDTRLLPIAVGFLGAYTTFSTFSYETFTLLRADRAPTALMYVLASLVGGVLAASAGYAVANRVD
jgi:fluoride exporter